MPIISTPQIIDGINYPVSSVAAGERHSVVAQKNGEVWTFGGAGGALGHGSEDTCYLPQRIEALIGRASIVSVAANPYQSLFLDTNQGLWASSNSHLKSAASDNGHHSLASNRANEHMESDGELTPVFVSSKRSAVSQSNSQSSSTWTEYQAQWHATHLKPLIDHTDRYSEILKSRFLMNSYQCDDLSAALEKDSAWLKLSQSSGSVERSGLHGDLHSIRSLPVLVGKGIADAGTGGLLVDTVGWIWTVQNNDTKRAKPLALPKVTDLVEIGGGAVKAGRGKGYSACLTRCGDVVIWLDDCTVQVVVLPMKAIDMAVGRDKLVCTDGSQVWEIDTYTMAPRKIALGMEERGIAQVAAGRSAFAAVTDAGELWLWGTLLTDQEVSSIVNKAEDEGFGHWAYSRDAESGGAGEWPGFGSGEPTRLLDGVKNVSIGRSHVLCTVE